MAQTWTNWGSYGGSSTSEQQIGSNVPSSHTYLTKVWVANRTAGALTFRVRTGSGSAGNGDYRAYDASCPANDIVVLPQFVTIAGDGLYVTQSANGLAFRADVLDVS